MSLTIRLAAVTAGLLSTVALVGAATLAGAWLFFRPALPSAEALRDVKLQVPLRIYTRDGRLIDQIGEKRRTPVDYEDIPQAVIDAFLAAEDDRFFQHPGFDYQGLARAALNLALTGSRSQGGSTITQQLARVYFLSRERTFVRKAKELILAMQIEREFSKQEILALYLNKIFLGQRAYGVGAAAEVYFGKTLAQLDIAEAATIAGLPKAPSVLNPVSDPERALERRAYVLRRMRELGYIDEPVYQAALATPMESRLHGARVALEAPYVSEMVRAEMVRRFGTDAYSDGYRVVTTIDSQLQAAAERAVRRALLEYDRRHGFRGPVARGVLADTTQDPTPVELESLLSAYPDAGQLRAALVLETGDDDSARFYVRGSGAATLPWENLRWRPYVNDDVIGDEPAGIGAMLRAGDVVYLQPTGEGWRLSQVPQVQGALVALDPADGAVAALVGGFDFSMSKFNRAVQSRRQPGSSFKPFIYSAALENGFTPATLVNDAPVVFEDEQLESTWRPENYTRRFYGPTRLREALVRSLNLVSVRVLLGTGLGAAVSHVRGFGLPESALPRDSSLALGSGGASPLDMAAGYAVFASGGLRPEHYLIDRIDGAGGDVLFAADPAFACRACPPEAAPDAREIARLASTEAGLVAATAPRIDIVADGVPVDAEVPDYPSVEAMIAHAGDWRPTASEAPRFVASLAERPERAVSPANAYLIYDMMRDVIQRGTGRRARELGRLDLAGKTGTSNDRRDAWFSGFNADMVAIAWVGFDQERSLGAGEEGGRTALPMWKYFMERALAGTGEAPLPRPDDIVSVRIDPATGLVARAGDPEAIFEIFEAGRVPAVAPDDGEPRYYDDDPGTASPAEQEPLF